MYVSVNYICYFSYIQLTKAFGPKRPISVVPAINIAQIIYSDRRKERSVNKIKPPLKVLLLSLPMRFNVMPSKFLVVITSWLVSCMQLHLTRSSLMSLASGLSCCIRPWQTDLPNSFFNSKRYTYTCSEFGVIQTDPSLMEKVRFLQV